MKAGILILMGLLGFCRSGGAQGFANLNFNSANLSAYGTGPAFVPIGDAIPGWTGYLGTNQQTTVLYNSVSTGEGNIAIVGANNQGVIPGNNYTVWLQAGPTADHQGNVSASIAQTGLIPVNALSILFTATLPYQAGWQVTIADNIIPVTQISLGNGYAVYGGNVSVFAGQVAELEFTAFANPLPPNNLALDAISFSTSPIPEPSVIGLSALGGLLLAWHYRPAAPPSQTARRARTVVDRTRSDPYSMAPRREVPMRVRRWVCCVRKCRAWGGMWRPCAGQQGGASFGKSVPASLVRFGSLRRRRCAS